MKDETRDKILGHLGMIRGSLTLTEQLILYPPALLNPMFIDEPKAAPIVNEIRKECDAIEKAINDESQSTVLDTTV